jgi:hypothetical protein
VNREHASPSCHITEVADRIDLTLYPESVLRRWGIANTNHVLDLALDLAGSPTRLRTKQPSSAVSWHHASSVFTGTGQTTGDVSIAYHGDSGARAMATGGKHAIAETTVRPAQAATGAETRSVQL